MNIEILKEKLFEYIKELGEIEVIDQTLSLAIFLKKINNLIEEKMEKIENELNSKMSLYNVKNGKFESKKEEILKKYKLELNKVVEKYEDRYINIQLELQGINSNQKIVLANWQKILEEREEIIKNGEQKQYLDRKKILEYKQENTLSSQEFYECDRLLKELINPMENIETKANACIEKFNNYNTLIDECLIEANICEKEAIDCIEDVVKYQFNDKLAQISLFTKINNFINKIVYRFSGSSKFEKEVINKMEADLEKIQRENNEIINNIEYKSCHFTVTILHMREKINEEFKLAIS